MEGNYNTYERRGIKKVIFHLTGPLAIAIDFIVWLVIHISVSFSVSKMRNDSFNPESWLYRERSWERNGRIYQAFLRIKTWKGLLPDGAALFNGGFRKKHLSSTDIVYLRKFTLETCRAELTHWVIFIFAIIFFIWNDWWISMIMIAYGFFVNVPCIVTQRYNRIRLRRIYD
jgi:glycosyl-4,4'-diaponeurosporenoate acyltransferase